MSHVAETSSYLTGLRTQAVMQLTDGMRPDLKRSSTSEAMTVLFRLASSPSTAGDALALLHELQVHQVEVEMQYEEIRQSRVELEIALRRQTALFERAPAGYLVVDDALVLCDVNRAAAHLLGVAGDELPGRTLAGFLTRASGEHLQQMLVRARSGAAPETFELHLLAGADGIRKLHATMNQDAAAGRFLLVLMAQA